MMQLRGHDKEKVTSTEGYSEATDCLRKGGKESKRIQLYKQVT